MKAWTVSDRNGEYGTEIVFAETRGKALALCLHDDVFEDCEWVELNARRFKEYDKFYNGDSKPDVWFDVEHRVRLVKDFGWSCFDPIDDYCVDCPAKEWCSHGNNC